MNKFRRKLVLGFISALFGANSLAATQLSQKKSANKKSIANNASNTITPPQADSLDENNISNTLNNRVTLGARLGINLAGIVDYGTELPFVDLFKQSSAWFVGNNTDGGDAAKLKIDAHGWVSQLPTGVHASTIICSLDNQHFPADDYVILYDGEGEISVPFYAVKLNKPGKLELAIDGQKGLFRLDIVKTNPHNYIKNIRVLAKKYENTHLKNPWQPHFLRCWQGVASIRLMDFMATNNAVQIAWNDRPQLNDASYALKGVPLELMIDLANRLQTEPWFCLPHMANDDYVKQFASIVKAQLKPNLRAWVEYSNEVWNGGFGQNAYAAKQGQALKLAEQPWEAAWKYTAHRSLQIFKIWGDVFGQEFNGKHQRFVRVIASQAASTRVAEQILSAEQAGKQADVLAIAPYINFSVPTNADSGVTDKVVANWNLDTLFDALNKVLMTETLPWIHSNKKLANQYDLKLVAYEAGQHLVGVAGAVNNEQLTQLFLKANADARMGTLYTQYLAAWTNNGGDLLCAFNSVGGWSKWGSWGLLQYDDVLTPKFRAVIDWAILRGQKMRL